jgi:hypothetical protein
MVHAGVCGSSDDASREGGCKITEEKSNALGASSRKAKSKERQKMIQGNMELSSPKKNSTSQD